MIKSAVQQAHRRVTLDRHVVKVLVKDLLRQVGQRRDLARAMTEVESAGYFVRMMTEALGRQGQQSEQGEKPLNLSADDRVAESSPVEEAPLIPPAEDKRQTPQNFIDRVRLWLDLADPDELAARDRALSIYLLGQTGAPNAPVHSDSSRRTSASPEVLACRLTRNLLDLYLEVGDQALPDGDTLTIARNSVLVMEDVGKVMMAWANVRARQSPWSKLISSDQSGREAIMGLLGIAGIVLDSSAEIDCFPAYDQSLRAYTSNVLPAILQILMIEGLTAGQDLRDHVIDHIKDMADRLLKRSLQEGFRMATDTMTLTVCTIQQVERSGALASASSQDSSTTMSGLGPELSGKPLYELLERILLLVQQSLPRPVRLNDENSRRIESIEAVLEDMISDVDLGYHEEGEYATVGMMQDTEVDPDPEDRLLHLLELCLDIRGAWGDAD